MDIPNTHAGLKRQYLPIELERPSFINGIDCIFCMITFVMYFHQPGKIYTVRNNLYALSPFAFEPVTVLNEADALRAFASKMNTPKSG